MACNQPCECVTETPMADQMTGIWNGHPAATADTEKYGDKMAAVAAYSTTNFAELSKAINKTVAVTDIVGVDFDPSREDSLQRDLQYLESAVSCLVETINELQRRTRDVRIDKPQLEEAKNSDVEKSRSTLSCMISNQTRLIRLADNKIAHMLAELDI